MTMLKFLEVHVVDHCNNNCRWCHNYSPFSPKKEYEAKDYFDGLDLLEQRFPEQSFGAISLMGGEPFLHSDLIRFAYRMKERYRKPLLITTNGFWMSDEAIAAYKDLWRILNHVKISRYPTIEKRLGGEEEMKRLAESIKKYNPGIRVDFPDKWKFNKLEFFCEPVEVELYCGNSRCIALLPDMTMHRCGAGAYAHFAPEGMLTDAFKNSKHMSYDLKQFRHDTYMFWLNRYPMDACAYCSFALKTKGGEWKVEKGLKPFNNEYEQEYHLGLAKRMLIMNKPDHARREAAYMRQRYGDQPEVFMLEGILNAHTGDMLKALHAFGNVLAMDSTNEEAARYVHSIQCHIKKQATP